MSNEQISQYIENERSRGVADAAIREQLLKNGWGVADVDTALGFSGGALAPMVAQAGQWRLGMIFRGRIGRWQYFLGTILLVLINFVAGFLPIIGIVVAIAVAVVCIGMEIRRLHDFGWSGWWVLWSGLIGIAGVMVFMFSMFGGVFMTMFAQGGEQFAFKSFGSIGVIAGGLMMLFSGLFSLYVLLKGSELGENKFGQPANPNRSLVDAILNK